MNLRCILLVVAALLIGCASTSVKEYQAPDGTSIKTVKCTSDPSKCFEQASQSCPNGGKYRVVASESHAGGLIADMIPGPVTWYAMTYACGPSDGKMPDFKFTGERYIPPSPEPAPIIVKQKSTVTNCTALGTSVSCSTY